MRQTDSEIAHKHFRLNAAKLKAAQRALGAATETETVEQALDLVLAESKRNQITIEANRRFLESGVKIEDVFGELEP